MLRNVKRIVLGLTTVGIATLQTNASELVCVNGDKLFKETNYAQQLKEQMQKMAQQLQREFNEKTKTIQEKLKQIQKELQSGLLTKEAKKAKEEEFIKLQRELQMYQLQYQQEMRNYFQSQFKKLNELVKSALEALSKKEGFKAVLNCQDLLYNDPSIDITDEVAKLVDQLAKEVQKGAKQK